MAAALVGGAFLSASLQVLFDRLASRQVVNFFKTHKLNETLVKKLKILMITVNKVLNDAEEKHITDTFVKEWLDEVKDAVYEAEDLLDEVAYEALRLEVEAEGSLTSTDQELDFVSAHNPFGKEMETKLEEVVEGLEYLVKQKDALGLKEGIGEQSPSCKISTSCPVKESGVFGREADEEAIINLLLSEDANEKCPGMIPIQGMGGIGKTTLARLVYNHGRAQERFGLKAWVSISSDFDVFKITKELLKEMDSKDCDSMTSNQLQLELKKISTDKRFLLVFDDVWNDKYDDWDELLKPLKFGAKGSKILFTTRNESVASVVKTVPTYRLEELSEDNCWLLFAKHAFSDRDASAHPDLEEIGRNVVKKCKGLPLAAKALGGLLRSKRSAQEWEKVLRSEIWDLENCDILPALRLSYHYLPSQMKQCFAYCSIFPKDCEFEKEGIIHLWMAEGLLVPPKGNKEMEEVGNEYFDDLVSRTFFQQSSGSSFKMHDLINDLATVVSGEFCFRLGDDGSRKAGKRTRHVLYKASACDPSPPFEGIHKAQFLRTFLQLSWYGNRIDEEAMNDFLPTLRRLRVLWLSNYFGPTKLSNSMGKLKHLRYLNLSATSIERLPKTMGTLYNLQTLILFECRDLVELPANMGNLVNMRHLDIRETNLQEMPPRMGRLKKLQLLTDFFVPRQNVSGIKELGSLQHLQGSLRIWNLHNVVDARDAVQADLKGKKHLKELELKWGGDTDDSQHARHVLEKLEPSTNVECLSIVGYGGTTFPNWIGDFAFSNMVSLKLSGCKYCFSLPPLGQLASLKNLLIAEFDGIMVVDSNFFGSSKSMETPFRSLERLTFERMPQWHSWISDAGEGVEAFPVLWILYIRKCPNLTKSLPSHLPSLRELDIAECPRLVACFPMVQTIFRVTVKDLYRFAELKKAEQQQEHFISISGFPSSDFQPLMDCYRTTLAKIDMCRYDPLKCFALEHYPKLKMVTVYDCPNFESLRATNEPIGELMSLYSLRIDHCSNFISFPKGGLPAPNLTKLLLFSCSNLKSLPEKMHSLLPSLWLLQIDNCQQLESFPEDGLPSKLLSLWICGCNKLISGRNQWGLQLLPSLSILVIGYSEGVETFPEEMLLPSTLSSLSIKGLENLKSLEYKGLQHLTSLGRLQIEECPNLQSMPEEGLPPSLSFLEVWECPLLEKRCEREEGEDWPKISNIPEIIID